MTTTAMPAADNPPARSRHHLDHALPAPGCGPADVLLIPDFVDGRTAESLMSAVLGRTSVSSSDGGGASPPPPSLPTTPGWTRAAGRAVRSFGGTVLGSTLLPAPLPPWAAALFDRLVTDAGLDWSEGEDGENGEGCRRHAGHDARQPNHILANSYPRGAGILPHTDGPAYAPLAAILSLGDDSPGVMRFFKAAGAGGDDGGAAAAGDPPTAPSPAPAFSVFLPPRSLLVFRGQAYTAHLHGLADADADGIDDSVLNAAAAREWVVAAGLASEGEGAVAGATTTTTVPRGPCRVSLTVRRVKKVKKGLLRL
jgi:alkylated DNA repair protein alkB homolog 6